jgi:hypothetical protein
MGWPKWWNGDFMGLNLDYGIFNGMLMVTGFNHQLWDVNGNLMGF